MPLLGGCIILYHPRLHLGLLSVLSVLGHPTEVCSFRTRLVLKQLFSIRKNTVGQKRTSVAHVQLTPGKLLALPRPFWPLEER